jgi:lipopolysaccharide transport system permease protein
MAVVENSLDQTALRDQTVIVIEPTKPWVALSLIDLWSHRELLYFLTWRDVKVRYKQTLLGVLWIVLQPLLTTIIFTVFLSMLARVPSEAGVPYPLLAYTGLLIWTFFSSAVMGSSNSIAGNAHLITKVYFPRLLVPMAAVAGRLLDFGISFVVLVGMMFYYRMAPKHIAIVPVLMLLTTLLALGFSLLISAMNVKYRDVGMALPVLIQLWMFVSPVLYSPTLIPAKLRFLYSLNPLVGIIDGFRAALFGRPFDLRALAISAVFTVVLLFLSAYTFRRAEKHFADLI